MKKTVRSFTLLLAIGALFTTYQPTQAVGKKEVLYIAALVGSYVAWDYCCTDPSPVVPECEDSDALSQLLHFYKWKIRGHRCTDPMVIKEHHSEDGLTVEYEYAKIPARGFVGTIVDNYKGFAVAAGIPIALVALVKSIGQCQHLFAYLNSECQWDECIRHINS